jgi:hypothetical protein
MGTPAETMTRPAVSSSLLKRGAPLEAGQPYYSPAGPGDSSRHLRSSSACDKQCSIGRTEREIGNHLNVSLVT